MTCFLSIEVRYWRGLEHLSLGDLAPGLNLVFGPNEAGKSRLFQALRFALWESYKGEAAHKKALRGWSSPESPWVAVELDHGGERYRLEKQFLKGAYAKLEGEGLTLKDEEAEERLAEILGTGVGRKSALGKEEQGLWRLLWVGQGDSRLPPSDDLNPEPKSRLQDLLSEELGEVAAGPMGQRVLERARLEAARYWTATGQPTGELRKLAKEEEAAKEACSEAQEIRNRQRKESDDLERAQRELETLGPRIAERLEVVDRERLRAAAAAEARQALETQRARLETLELQARQARSELDRYQAAAAETESAKRSLEERRGELQRLEGELVPREDKLKAARQATEQAQKAWESARSMARKARAREELRRRTAELEALEARYGEAAAAGKILEALNRQLAANPVTREAVAELERLERGAREAQARLDGASAGLHLEALREIRVSREEGSAKSLAPGEEVRLLFSAPGHLEIEGVARLEILPGGEGLARLREGLEAQRSALVVGLEKLGVEDLATARSRLEAKRKGEGEKEVAGSNLQVHAPEGLEALGDALELGRGALKSLRRDESEVRSETLTEKGTAKGAEDAETAAEETFNGARATSEASEEALQGARARRASLAQAVASLEEQLERAEGNLASLPPAEELVKAEEVVSRQRGEALLQREALERRFAEAGGDAARLDLEQAERALLRLEEERRGLQREIDGGKARLSVLGGEGAHDKLQDREASLEEIRGRLGRLQRRANAARKLLETLEEERRQAQQRLTEPVRQRIEPYLRELFPGSALAVDENWQVLGLQTANVEEGFGSLSGGAQEQLSLLVRIGLGEILAGEGRLPLILDDALVNSDAERREILLRILGRAAAHLQVIVFTCHDDNYDALGAHRAYRLPPSRSGA